MSEPPLPNAARAVRSVPAPSCSSFSIAPGVGFWHDVDYTTNRALAVNHGGRPAQHIDMIDEPGVERVSHTDRAVWAQAVVESRHGGRANKATSAKLGTTVTGMRGRAKTSGATYRVDDRPVPALSQRATVDLLDAGRRFQRSQAEMAACFDRLLQLVFFSGIYAHGVQGLLGRRGGDFLRVYGGCKSRESGGRNH